MHIICNKESLLRGIRITESSVSTKATMPILSNILIETEDKKTGNKLKMASTNLEIGIKCYIDAEIKTGGGIAIPAKRFGSIISELNKDNPIEIKVDKEFHMDIKSGKSHFIINGTPKEDYPAIPDFSDDKSYTLESNKLYNMIKKTIFAVSTEEIRYNLSGVYFVITKDQLKLVATDGRRLSYIFDEISSIKEKNKIIETSAIIPAKTLNEFLKIITFVDPKLEKKIKLNIGENQAGFRIEDIVLISRVVDGTFPNYEQVIPKKNQNNAVVNTQELLSGTKQLSLIISDRGGAIKFNFKKTSKGDELNLSAVNQGIGSGEVDVEAKLDGEQIETAFNPEYIIDILKNIDEEKTVFSLNGPLDAVIIRPENAKNYICVVMPMRI